MKVTKDTIIRTAILFLALINDGLRLAGKSILPITDDQIQAGMAFAWTAGAALAAWWKNNSFTKAAMLGDKAMKDAKEQAAG